MTTQYDPTTPYPQQPMGGYPPPGGGHPFVPQQQVPGIGPVIAFTAIFGVFGAISAARRSGKAKRAGQPTSKYWVAFGITLAVVWAVGGIIGAIASMGAAKSTTPPVTAAPAASAVVVPAKEAVATAAPSASAVAEDNLAAGTFDAEWLQGEVAANGDFKGPDGEPAEVDSATCSAVDVDEQGAGSYQCVIDFVSGERESQNIIVDPSGAWVTNS